MRLCMEHSVVNETPASRRTGRSQSNAKSPYLIPIKREARPQMIPFLLCSTAACILPIVREACSCSVVFVICHFHKRFCEKAYGHVKAILWHLHIGRNCSQDAMLSGFVVTICGCAHRILLDLVPVDCDVSVHGQVPSIMFCRVHHIAFQQNPIATQAAATQFLVT